MKTLTTKISFQFKHQSSSHCIGLLICATNYAKIASTISKLEISQRERLPSEPNNVAHARPLDGFIEHLGRPTWKVTAGCTIVRHEKGVASEEGIANQIASPRSHSVSFSTETRDPKRSQKKHEKTQHRLTGASSN